MHTVRTGKAVLVTVGLRIRGVLRARGDGNIGSFSRGTIACCGAQASRGSPYGFARAVDFEPRVFTDVVQLRGGNIATEDVEAPDKGLKRDFGLIGSASFGSCRPPPTRSLLRCGGT